MPATCAMKNELQNAAHCNQFKRVRDLIVAGGDINEGMVPDVFCMSADDLGKTALHCVIEGQVYKNRNGSPAHPGDRMPLLKWLINNGADSNLKDKNGITPLHTACLWNDYLSAKYLIEHGRADVNATTKWKDTPLKLSCGKDAKIELVTFLLEKGANPNSQDSFTGETPLLKAVSWGQIEVVRLLLDAGADTKIRDNTGRTVLHKSIVYDHTKEMVDLLIAHGADINQADNRGTTPTASHVGLHSKIFEYMKSIGGQVRFAPQPESSSILFVLVFIIMLLVTVIWTFFV